MRLLIILFTLCAVGVSAQNERDYIRRGNRLMRDTVYAKAQAGRCNARVRYRS